MKETANANVFRSAGSIVKDALSDHQNDVIIPKQMNLQRNANRYRQKFRPQDPKDLHTPLSYEFGSWQLGRRGYLGSTYLRVEPWHDPT